MAGTWGRRRSRSSFVQVVAKLPGYNDQEVKLNPLEIDASKSPLKITLEKPKTGPPRPVQIVPKQGSATNTTGGSARVDGLGGFPVGPGSNVQKK
jgi:hypothetical protein